MRNKYLILCISSMLSMLLFLNCDNDSDNSNSCDASQVTEIFMYQTTTITSNGNIAGIDAGKSVRENADQLCSNDKPAHLTCSNVHAILSIDAADEIRDMPSNYCFSSTTPIKDQTDTNTLFNSWTDMLDESDISSSIMSAAMLNDSGLYNYFTGSNPDGSLGNNCNDWTSADNGVSVNWGYGNTTDTNWISYNSTSYCSNANMDLLCVCY